MTRRAGTSGRLRAGLLAPTILLAISSVAAPASAATDGSYQDVYWMNSCTAYGNAAPAFSGSTNGALWNTPNQCGSQRSLEINTTTTVVQGKWGKWGTQTPDPRIKIIGVYTPSPVNGSPNPLADCNLHTDGFMANYFWGDNGVNYGTPGITVNCHGATTGLGQAGSLNQKIQASRYFGWQASCSASSCTSSAGNGGVFGMAGISLEAQETSGPALNAVGANNLYYQSGWVRGVFPTDLAATDPSGVCSLQTAINGTAINTYVDSRPDTSNWSQCPGSSLASSVDTTKYANGAGAISLWYYSSNAAGAASIATHAINVDNAPVGVSLTGPSDALSTAGTQFVTASAVAGASGVAGIACATDGAAFGFHPGASAQIPVAGIGPHQIRCYAQNNALNASGQPATSPVQAFTMQIRQPTAAAISFAKIKNALRCHLVTVKTRLPGKLRSVRRHGHTVKVRGRARVIKRRVRRCHARTVRRTVTVIVRRHGQPVKVKKVVRVVLLPRTVRKSTLRVGHGRATTVSGFLGAADGTALAGRTVEVLVSPDNGLGHFAPIAKVITSPSGGWSARVPAGPSRWIEAVYAGDGTTEPVSSTTVRLIVPARVRLLSVTRRVAWGGTVNIVGELDGGYLPPGGALVRLLIGYGNASATYGVKEHVTSKRFTAAYSFGPGDPSHHATYSFALSTLPMSSFPWSPAHSGRRYVIVGGHPSKKNKKGTGHHKHRRRSRKPR